jgi:hypothetical protein
MATAKNIPSAPTVALGAPDSLPIAAHSDPAKKAGKRDHNGTDRVIAMTA